MVATFNLNKYNKAEFALITCLYMLVMLNLFTVAINENLWLTDLNSMYSYHSGILVFWLSRYTALYFGYVLAHFFIIKKIILTGISPLNVIMVGVTVIVITLVWAFAEIWSRFSFFYFFEDIRYNLGTGIKILANNFLKICGITLPYIIYTYLKYDEIIISKINNITGNTRSILIDCYWLFLAWIITFTVIHAAAILALPIILVYAYLSLRLIPLVKSSNKDFGNYFGRVTLIALSIAVPVFFIYAIAVHQRVQQFALLVIAYASFMVFVISTLTWADRKSVV